ncbi:MAG: FtsL-like putative cell division protein, partial [Bacteroidota bacterium]
MNKVKSDPQETKQESSGANEARKSSVAVRFAGFFNVFALFDRRRVIAFMPFAFFLFLLALIYIGNSYYAEKSVREIDRVGREIKELHSEFITTKSELMSRSKLTEVARSIQIKGIREST